MIPEDIPAAIVCRHGLSILTLLDVAEHQALMQFLHKFIHLKTFMVKVDGILIMTLFFLPYTKRGDQVMIFPLQPPAHRSAPTLASVGGQEIPPVQLYRSRDQPWRLVLIRTPGPFRQLLKGLRVHPAIPFVEGERTAMQP